TCFLVRVRLGHTEGERQERREMSATRFIFTSVGRVSFHFVSPVMGPEITITVPAGNRDGFTLGKAGRYLPRGNADVWLTVRLLFLQVENDPSVVVQGCEVPEVIRPQRALDSLLLDK